VKLNAKLGNSFISHFCFKRKEARERRANDRREREKREEREEIEERG